MIDLHRFIKFLVIGFRSSNKFIAIPAKNISEADAHETGWVINL